MKEGFLILLLAFVSGVHSVHAADIKAGKKASLMCSVCHGKDGISVNPEAPNLAGESAFYIEKQLLAFQQGKRQHAQMSIIAQGLKKEQIEDLAAWYEAIEVTATLPTFE